MGFAGSLNLQDDNAKVAAGVSAVLSLACVVYVVVLLCQVCKRRRLRSQTTYRDVAAAAVDIIDCGNNREAIDMCPVFVYSELEMMENIVHAVECAVCLSEFEDCDVVKMLPRCEHVFHQHCIDAWLSSSRMDCPICREKVTFDDNNNIDNSVPTTEEQDQVVLGTESEVAEVTASEQPEHETVVDLGELDTGQVHSQVA